VTVFHVVSWSNSSGLGLLMMGWCKSWTVDWTVDWTVHWDVVSMDSLSLYHNLAILHGIRTPYRFITT